MTIRIRGWMEVHRRAGMVFALVRPSFRASFQEEWVRVGGPIPLAPGTSRFDLKTIYAGMTGGSGPDLDQMDASRLLEALNRSRDLGRLLLVEVPEKHWDDLSRARVRGGTEGSTGGKTEQQPTVPASIGTGGPARAKQPLPAWQTITISLVGDDGRRLPRIRYRVALSDERVISGSFDGERDLILPGLEPGTCRFTLPDLDHLTWSTVSGGGPGAITTVAGSADDHRLVDGEGTSVVAPSYGFSPEAVWNDKDNAALVRTRRHPNQLLPGDVLAIPTRKRKELTLAIGQTHVFKHTGARTLVAIQVFDGESPRANQSWEAQIGTQKTTGTSDGDGVVELWMAPDERTATLTIGNDKREFRLDVDRLHPVEETNGVQQRLANLGFWWEIPDRTPQERLAAAVRSFQVRVGLDPSGEVDDPTKQKLAEIHDRRGALPVEPAIKYKA